MVAFRVKISVLGAFMKRTIAGASAALALLSVGEGYGQPQSGKDSERKSGSSQNVTPDGRERRSEELSARPFYLWKKYLDGREVRSIDGSGNNVQHPDWGRTFTQFKRMSRADYADGVAAMAGPLRKSPREITNLVFHQGPVSMPNSFGTSDFLWQWGQFIDHDLTLGDGVLEEGPDAHAHYIKVPAGDPHFDPQGAGNKYIAFDRAIYDPDTGTGPDNPRQQQNELTAWIDGSMVYGSNDERAKALRRLDGSGKLKTSKGGLLPFNTGNLPNANGPAPDPTKLFLAGDVRSNEQPGLTAMHTLFVREHNRLAEVVRKLRPYYSDEDIYQAARRLVIAEIQIITYEEFLPAAIGPRALPRYRGYDPSREPSIMTEFSGAAYRFGHTAVSPVLQRVDRRGRTIPEGALSLRQAFFNAPSIIKSANDIDPILRGLASQRHQRIDSKVIDDLRSFLFGPPGAGGLDLTALNIQRARDRGIPTYNEVRKALGLKRAKKFSDISSDTAVQKALYIAYGSIDEVELWTGGLAEDPVWRERSQLGETFREILIRQFAALRDGDRFWYERDLGRLELALVGRATLAKIIRANTAIGAELQDDAFYVRQ